MNRSVTFLEALEARIAPAALGVTLHGMNSVTYTEADGDVVTVKFSKKIFDGENANALDGVFSQDDTTGGLVIDLSGLAHSDVANGTDITITVKKLEGGSGDGLVEVHEIDSDGSLGNVNIAGNLGSVYINNNEAAPLALKSLTVNSMANAEDSLSEISGNVGSITVTGNVSHGIWLIGDGASASAKIDSVTVGGDWTASSLAVGISRSLGLGGADSLFGTSDDRPIGGNSSIGSLTIGGLIVAGSDGMNYGIEAGSFGHVTIGQVDRSSEFSNLEAYTPLALTEVANPAGGGVFAERVIAPNGLVDHTLTSASVVSYHEADGDLVTVKFSKALFTGRNAGDLDNVFSFDSATGSIQSIDFNGLYNSNAAVGIGMTFSVTKVGSSDGVAGDVQSIYADRTLGAIKGIGNLGSIVIANHQQEGLALKSLSVRSMVWDHLGDFKSEIDGNVGTVTIAGGFSDLQFIVGGSVQSLSVGGDISGGDNENTGFAFGSVKTITVGNIIGSNKDNSAQIYVDGNVGAITTGDIGGGMGQYSGMVYINGNLTTGVTGNLTGNNGDYSGIFYARVAGHLTLGDFTGGGGMYSGTAATDKVTTAKLGDLTGGNGRYSGAFNADIAGSIIIGNITGGDGENSGILYTKDTAKVTAANVTAGTGDFAGEIFIENADAETAVTVTGKVDGTDSTHAAIISTGNIKTLTIGGDVTNAALVAKNFGDITITGDVTTTKAAKGIFTNTIKSFTGLNLSGDSDNLLNFQVSGYTGDGYTKKDAAIGSFTATNMAYTIVNAGYLADDAKVTSVTVNGDWVASALDVGVVDGVDNIPYTSDDVTRGVSHLGTLTIKGAIIGTTTDGDNFGIRASVFDKITFGTTRIDAITTYAANTPTVLSSSGTPGHGAVYIERGLPLSPPAGV